MKQIILLLCISFFGWSFQSCTDDSGKGQDKLAPANVPAAVVSAFNAKYPGATDVEWDKGKEGDKQTYKAEYKSGDKKIKAEFGEDGSFIKEKRD